MQQNVIEDYWKPVAKMYYCIRWLHDGLRRFVRVGTTLRFCNKQAIADFYSTVCICLLKNTFPSVLHYNTRCHVANNATFVLRRWQWEILEYPSYFPDMNPCDFVVFPMLKKPL
ncbi:hypothetical protein TNCV_1867991 [Trichonephila clavipes]|nr:hypothetical protein TNCV_1867991 [Trichonephila clavipes]